MGRTPDRTHGPALEEELQLENNGADPSVVGAITQNGGVLKGKDSIGVFDLRSGTGLSEAAHRNLDQLPHLIAEDSFEEYTYSGNKVTDIIIWTDDGKTVKIREENYTFSGSQVSTVVTKQYDGAGTIIVGETMTETFSYSGNTVTSIARVLS
jgi:hypothetical protein